MQSSRYHHAESIAEAVPRRIARVRVQDTDSMFEHPDVRDRSPSQADLKTRVAREPEPWIKIGGPLPTR